MNNSTNLPTEAEQESLREWQKWQAEHHERREAKGYTSFKLRREFPHLARLRSLWTRSYFVSTAGNVSSQTVERYIAEQRKR